MGCEGCSSRKQRPTFFHWLDFVAIGALRAYAWRVEPRVFALLAVAMGLPNVVDGPLAGVLVDRAPLRGVMVAANLGMAAATASLSLAGQWDLLLVLMRGTMPTCPAFSSTGLSPPRCACRCGR